MDAAGNSNSRTHTYTVAYDFGGFTGPVAGGGVVNIVKAGQTIPLIWRLVDAGGEPVTDLTAVALRTIDLQCESTHGGDPVGETSAGKSGLQNLGDGYYQYNWKTPKSYAGSCKKLELAFAEGNAHSALLRFTK
jgi:hypothetical protein